MRSTGTLHPLINRLIQPGRGATLMRRAITIPSYLILASLVWFGLPLWLLLTMVADFIRDAPRPPRFIFTRLLLFAAGYLLCEIGGVLIAFLLWLGRLLLRPSAERYRAWNFRLQCDWGAMLLRIGQTAFSYRFEITGADALAPGPILLLLRHTSLADTVLAVSQISRPHHIVLRYVLKRPLLIDPCIDIVGQRLINLFVLKGSGSRRQIEAVAALAKDLQSNEGVLIYPEGTRFTEAKRQAHLDKLERRGQSEELAFAASLKHILPPIRGGIMALLDANQQLDQPADVLWCAHSGFEGSATTADLATGRLLGRTIRIHFWRVRHEQIPTEPAERNAWLEQQWSLMDDTVHRLSTEAG